MSMIDATLASFERDVLQASRELPVVVDFWAPWCGPCRALGPLLEKLERESGGRWRLVKVNSDENPELSAQFKVRSIPFVVAFAGGQLNAGLGDYIAYANEQGLVKGKKLTYFFEDTGYDTEKSVAAAPAASSSRVRMCRPPIW